MPVADNRLNSVSRTPEGFGLNCTALGLDFAGVPLLRRDGAAFTPRPAVEIGYLLKRAYRAEGTVPAVGDMLETVAYALNCGQTAAAAALVRALHLPRLDWDGAVRIAYADAALRKAYNPNEPRDWHGRWTSGGGSDRVHDHSRPSSGGARPLQLAAGCQGFPSGCQSGGSYGSSGMYIVGGRILCAACAIKILGVENEPPKIQIQILRPFLLGGPGK